MVEVLTNPISITFCIFVLLFLAYLADSFRAYQVYRLRQQLYLHVGNKATQEIQQLQGRLGLKSETEVIKLALNTLDQLSLLHKRGITFTAIDHSGALIEFPDIFGQENISQHKA